MKMVLGGIYIKDLIKTVFSMQTKFQFLTSFAKILKEDENFTRFMKVIGFAF